MRALRIGLILVACNLACGDEDLGRVEPKIVVDPESLDFGDGVIDRDNVVTLEVKNIGAGQLVVSNLRFEGAPVFSAAPIEQPILQQRTFDLPVIFVPTTPKEVYTGTLIIESNDSTTPALEVPLMGVGGIREIEVVPGEIDFGTVNEGAPVTRGLEIKNIGGDPLIISALTWTSTSVDMGPVDLPVSLTLEALTSTVIDFRYDPQDLGADSGVLTIESNDEDEPVVTVPVFGDANLAPRAIAWICNKVPDDIGCDGQLKLRRLTAGFGEILGLEGRDSSDPEGGTVTNFRWTVVEAPDPSPLLVFSSEDRMLRNGATGEVETRAVGSTIIRLVVTDERGLESLDRPESRVEIRPRDVEVYLRWDIDTDVDLHFVRPGGQVGDYGSGSVGTSTGSDASSFNRGPDWGVAADPTDDPSLDRDVVSARGPEIVSLDAPEQGTYRAFAHYCDSRNRNVNANVWLEVYARGVLVARVPEGVESVRMLPSNLWEGAEIVWDAQNETVTVTPVDTLLGSRPELCRLN